MFLIFLCRYVNWVLPIPLSHVQYFSDTISIVAYNNLIGETALREAIPNIYNCVNVL